MSSANAVAPGHGLRVALPHRLAGAEVDASEAEVLREFVASRSARLYRIAYVLTGDHHHAEDLLQAALVKAASSWRRIRDHAALEGYVRRTMYRDQVGVWRRRGVLTEWRTAQPPETPTGDHTDHTDLKVVVRDALARLSPKQRAVLTLRYFEDLPEGEVAELLGVSVGTVRSTAHKALTRLRSLAPELDTLAGSRTTAKEPT